MHRLSVLAHPKLKMNVRKLFSILIALIFLSTTICMASERLEKAPDFAPDAQWIDAGPTGQAVPHSIEGYRGKVLLVDFWEYTCINCIRDFSVLKRWYGKYHRYGFDVVGVHFGEFPMGFNANNVRNAAKRFQLPWPVVADVKGSIWNAYHSDVWPNRYLIDQNGYIVQHVEGEGNNRPMEEKIRELLVKAHPEINRIPLDPPENTFAPSCGISTDETYVGNWYGRGAVANSRGYSDNGSATDFRADGEPQDGRVMLSGKWITQQDGMTSDDEQSRAQLRYHARSVYAVLSVGDSKKPVRVNLLQDGKPLNQSDAGADVRFDPQGSYLEVDGPRMYDLVKNGIFASHLLTLEPQTPGFALHSFTYGNDCQQNFKPM